MAGNFPEFLVRLEEFGLLDALLPFVLIYTIVFAVLQKTKVIGEGRKNFNVAVSLILSLMVVIPHVTGRYPPGQDVVVIINSVLPQVSLLVIAILMALLLIGVFAPGVMFKDTAFGGVLALFSVGAVVYIFGNAAGLWSGAGALSFLNDPDTQAVLLIIVVFGLIIWFITRDDGGSDFKLTENIKNFFLGGGRH